MCDKAIRTSSTDTPLAWKLCRVTFCWHAFSFLKSFLIPGSNFFLQRTSTRWEERKARTQHHFGLLATLLPQAQPRCYCCCFPFSKVKERPQASKPDSGWAQLDWGLNLWHAGKISKPEDQKLERIQVCSWWQCLLIFSWVQKESKRNHSIPMLVLQWVVWVVRIKGNELILQIEDFRLTWVLF